MNANASRSNPYAPPRANVEDPLENREAELAGRGMRLSAALLDLLAGIFLVYLPLMIALGRFNLVAITASPKEMVDALGQGVAGAIALIGLSALVTINIILVRRNGQSIGKKIVGIKVVRFDGSRASLGRIFWLRNVTGWAMSALPLAGRFYGIIDAVYIFVTTRKQCLHDKIADTIVVMA